MDEFDQKDVRSRRVKSGDKTTVSGPLGNGPSEINESGRRRISTVVP